jgi:hypothetical protein
MARCDHLPVYKKTFELLLELHKLYPNFDRKYKFGLCSDLLVCVKNSLLLIVRVNNQTQKLDLLQELLFCFEEIQIQIRLLKCLNIIKKSSYFNLSEMLINIVKQCEGWRSYVVNN